MAKSFEQIIVSETGTNGVSGSIYSLGIQGVPGTAIDINNNQTYNLILNTTGVFSINIEDDMPPINSVAIKQNGLLGPVYIDIVYEGELSNETIETEGQANG